jgi:uncharacterized protein
MPVTSSSSSIKRWPSPDSVLEAARRWARELLDHDPSVRAVGCIGSYARGDAGFGSDLDLVIVRQDGAAVPALLGADVDALPVPADVLHYAESSFADVLARGGRMGDVLQNEVVWLARRRARSRDGHRDQEVT